MEHRHRTVWRDSVPQRSTPLITGAFMDHYGVAVPKASLLTASMLVWDETSAAQVRAAFDILPFTNTDGSFAIPLVSGDTEILTAGSAYETRVLQMTWTWGNYRGYHEIALMVKNLVQVGSL